MGIRLVKLAKCWGDGVQDGKA